jgi:hypothetical protein
MKHMNKGTKAVVNVKCSPMKEQFLEMHIEFCPDTSYREMNWHKTSNVDHTIIT